MELSQARVMVIEDQKVMQIFLLGSLRRIGIHDLHAFADAREALAAVGTLQPDLVLSDVLMQPLDGIGFVCALRDLPDARARATRVILVSGDTSQATLQAACALDVCAFLHKPATAGDLAKAITLALAR